MMETNPDDPFILYALAREYELQSGVLQALLMYEHLINAHPEYVATYYHYSKLLYSAGNRFQAIELLKKGIEKGISGKDLHAVSEMQGLLAQWTLEEDEEE